MSKGMDQEERQEEGREVFDEKRAAKKAKKAEKHSCSAPDRPAPNETGPSRDGPVFYWPVFPAANYLATGLPSASMTVTSPRFSARTGFSIFDRSPTTTQVSASGWMSFARPTVFTSAGVSAVTSPTKSFQ